jgi:uncharacterized protein DUF6702
MVALLALMALIAPATVGHPIHTAVTQIRYHAETSEAEIEIRVFADDLAHAAGDSAAASVSAARRYLSGKFAMTSGRGDELPLNWVGIDRSGDVVIFRLRAMVPGGLGGGSVVSTILCERFSDQVNVVRVSIGPHTSTFLFTRGEKPKPL